MERSCTQGCRGRRRGRRARWPADRSGRHGERPALLSAGVARAEQLGQEHIQFLADAVGGAVTGRGAGREEHSGSHAGHDHHQAPGDQQNQRHPKELDHKPMMRPPALHRNPDTTLSEGEFPVPRTVDTAAMSPLEPITVVIVDDHSLVREGTARLLDQEQDLSVVGQAGNAEDAIALLGVLHPSVALVDLNLPGMSGLDLARWCSANEPGVRVVVLTAYDDRAFVDEAIDAGVSGYLLKTATARELVKAVQAVAGGIFVMDNMISRRLSERPSRAAAPATGGLTSREAEVLRLLARGLANKRIAAELGLGVRTVEGYMSSLLGKLGVASRTEAVLYALDHNLLPAESDDPGRPR